MKCYPNWVVLNIMVWCACITNYMLRANINIAIVAMVRDKTLPEEENKDRLAWGQFEKQQVLASYLLGYSIAEIPGGRLAELYGTKVVLGTSMLFAGLLTVATPAICKYHWAAAAVLRVLLGCSVGVIFPSLQPLIARWVPIKYRTFFISHLLANPLGTAIMFPTGGYIIYYSNWTCVFYFTAGVCFIWVLLWYLLVYDTPESHKFMGDAERTWLIENRAGPGVKKGGKAPWLKIFTSCAVWVVIITQICHQFGYFVLSIQIPSYCAKVLDVEIKKNGLFSSLPYIGRYTMSLIGGIIADRIRDKVSKPITRRIYTTISMGMPAVFMFCQAVWGTTLLHTISFFTAAMFCNGAINGGHWSSPLDFAPNYAGTIFGASITFGSFCGYCSSYLVTYLIQSDEKSFDNWRWLWVFCGALYTIGYLTFFIFMRTTPISWNETDS